MNSLTLITPPSALPLTLDQAKAHLRVLDNAEDDVIGLYLAAAVRAVETRTGRPLTPTTYRLTADRFPGTAFTWREGIRLSEELLPMLWFELPQCPVRSVSSVRYMDPAGTGSTWLTMDATGYVLDAAAAPARLSAAWGSSWPVALPVPGSVRVDFIAGYDLPTAPSMVYPPPADLLHAVKATLGTLYEHREAVVLGNMMPAALPDVAEALLSPYIVYGGVR